MSEREAKSKNKQTTRKKSQEERVSGLFSLEELSSLLEMLTGNDVTEFELERGEETLKLKRGAQQIREVVTERHSHVPVMLSQQGQHFEAPAASAPQRTEAEPEGTKLSVIEGSKGAGKGYHEVTSPMVGTFYRRPSPDANPFVDVGETVQKGSVLCIVEAMKLMNEIESDISGRVVEVCLEDGQMVEYGEVLFRIEPA